MIAVDTNVVVYAHREESPHHDRALQAVRGLAEGEVPWAFRSLWWASSCGL